MNTRQISLHHKDAAFVFRAKGKNEVVFQNRKLKPNSKSKRNELEAFTLGWLLSKPILFEAVYSLCRAEMLQFEAKQLNKKRSKS